MRKRIEHAALLALVLLVAACAALTLRDPPRIEIVDVRLDRVVGPDAYFSVEVTLTNRMDRDLVVDALQGTLAIEGESVAQAALAAAPVHLPGNGTARAEMNAHAGMDAVLRAIAAAMRRGAMIMGPGERPALRYTIEGSAVLAGGARVPFHRSGEIGGRRS